MAQQYEHKVLATKVAEWDATDIEKEQYKDLEERYTKALASGMLATKQAVSAKIFNSNRGSSLSDLMFNSTACYPRFEDLNDSGSVHNMDLDSVKNIWIARFGSGWSKDSDTATALADSNHFWRQVFYRLRGDLEQCNYEEDDGKLAYAWRLKEKQNGNR